MKKIVFVFAVCLSVLTYAQEKSGVEVMTEANQALEAKEYAKAIELYEKVLTIPNHGMDEASIKNALSQLKPIVIGDRASDALGKKDYETALSLYKGLVNEFPEKIELNEKAGKGFFNQGGANYKASDFVGAATCYTIAEKEFKFDIEKTSKYKEASIKKLAKQLAGEGKTSAEVAGLSDENKTYLKENIAKAYVSDGNDQYKSSVEIINVANTKVKEGTLKIEDDAYIAEINKAKEGASNAIKILEKAIQTDASNTNAQKLIDACKAIL